jgi:hypothetical protein
VNLDLIAYNLLYLHLLPCTCLTLTAWHRTWPGTINDKYAHLMSCFEFYLQMLREHKTLVRRLVKFAIRSLTELHAPRLTIYAMHIRSAQESTPSVTQGSLI